MRRAALTALGALLVAAPAHAAPRELTGLRDARTCELATVTGTPPSAAVTVWSTLGARGCPAALWHFDPAALARELGVAQVVLDGPRHLVVDALAAPAGPARGFHGLAMRRVARTTAARASDVVPEPFVDRASPRRDVPRWRAGRAVHELVAPGGDTYVMRSYSRGADPALRLGTLRAAVARLWLPEGWRARTRVLRRPLVLDGPGPVTLTRDELGNEYQLATTVRRGPRRPRAVALDGTTATVPSHTPGTIEDHGSVTGTPFGSGTLVLVGRFGGGRLTGTVRMTFPRGSVLAAVDLPFTIAGNDIDFRGTSRLIGGTGAYRGITSGALATHDRNTLDGQHGVVTVTGTATY